MLIFLPHSTHPDQSPACASTLIARPGPMMTRAFALEVSFMFRSYEYPMFYYLLSSLPCLRIDKKYMPRRSSA